MDSKLKHILIPFIMMMALLWITSKEKYYYKESIRGYSENTIRLTNELIDN